jgi:hypothetical protein
MLDETVETVAARIDRVADRFAAAGDSKAEKDARRTARDARMCKSVAEAWALEQAFNARRGIGRPAAASADSGGDVEPASGVDWAEAAGAAATIDDDRRTDDS